LTDAKKMPLAPPSGKSRNAPDAQHRKRRKRDPQGTREALLEAAWQQLARDGKQGVSVAQVAQLAGVNRGTAYQHLRTRQQLIEAATQWFSAKLYRAVFGDPKVARTQPVESIKPVEITQQLAEFAMENPEVGRVWLFELLSSRRPADDPFWQQYFSNLQRYANTELAQPGIDAEVVSVLLIAGALLWPVWARAHAHSPKQRKRMSQRFTREVLRLCMHGTVKQRTHFYSDPAGDAD
jgi:AcrR family transcriptional regulator